MQGFDFKNICKKSIGAFLCTSMAGGALTQAFEQGKSEKNRQRTGIYTNSTFDSPKQEEKSGIKWMIIPFITAVFYTVYNAN